MYIYIYIYTCNMYIHIFTYVRRWLKVAGLRSGAQL